MTRQEKINEPRMKMVYIAHPFNGLQENIADAQNIILKLLKKYPDTTFYSPLHATGFFYFELSYEDGMEHCYEALRRCDEIWFCEGWQNSRGCNLEMKFAQEHGIPIFYVTNDGEGSKSTGRADILHAAEKCVCGDREADYGNPEDSFKAIASMWNSYLYAIGLIENHTDEWKGLKPKDIAAMMVLFKIARVATGHGKLDNWIDAAGYAANGGECEANGN